MTEKVLVITGASRGIGAATAVLAARELGYAICVNYATNPKAAHKVVEQIVLEGGRAQAVQADVGRPGDIKHLFAEADKLGSLAGLVNNAGVADTGQRVDEMDAARLTRMWNTNISGCFLCAGEAIRRMSTKHGGAGGAIVNLSSAAAKLGAGGAMVDYAASKGAVDSFTLGLALEVAGENIRVNGVRPGIIDTELHAQMGDAGRVARISSSLPMPRAGTAAEVAEAIVWLLSDKSSYTTGTVVAVSGGRGIVV